MIDDRALQDQLTNAENEIGRVEELVVRQRELIAHSERLGWSTKIAREYLQTLEGLGLMAIDHRERILKKVEAARMERWQAAENQAQVESD